MARKYIIISLMLIIVAMTFRYGSSPEDGAAFIQGLRDVIRPIAHVYLALFGQPEASLLLAFGLFVFCIGLLLTFWFGQVRSARATLTRTTTDILSRAVVPEGNEIEAISHLMNRTPLLEDEWRMFQATLVTRHTDRGGQLFSTIRPNEYFSMEAMESRGLDFRFYNALPNYAVGLGLLFTFMSLVAGLYFAGKGLEGADFNAARMALGKLLNASTMKFTSSVAGVGSSLLVAVTVRLWHLQVQRGLDDLCRALELRFPLVTAEMLYLERYLERGDHSQAKVPTP